MQPFEFINIWRRRGWQHSSYTNSNSLTYDSLFHYCTNYNWESLHNFCSILRKQYALALPGLLIVINNNSCSTFIHTPNALKVFLHTILGRLYFPLSWLLFAAIVGPLPIFLWFWYFFCTRFLHGIIADYFNFANEYYGEWKWKQNRKENNNFCYRTTRRTTTWILNGFQNTKCACSRFANNFLFLSLQLFIFFDHK